MTALEKHMWELWDYFDVWGNEQDGWEVNNQTKVEENIVVGDNWENDDIVKYLVQQGYFKTEVKPDNLYILWECDYIEIYDKENGKPLYCFRKQYI